MATAWATSGNREDTLGKMESKSGKRGGTTFPSETTVGEVASRSSGSVTRDAVFMPDSIKLKASHTKRRRGRTRASWAKHLHAKALNIAGGEAALEQMWSGTQAAKSAWKAAVTQHCNACG